MNKITTLTAVGFAVLLMLSVMPASAIKQVSSFESAGPIVNATWEYEVDDKNVSFDANDLPMFYIDLDDLDFDPDKGAGEILNITLDDVDKTSDDGIYYYSKAWTDENNRLNIAWLGEKYLAVGNDTTKLSKYIVDFESDEKITIKQSDVWDIGNGFTLTVQDIDVNGEQVWLALEQDGTLIENIIAFGGEWGYYNDTLAGESDVVIAKIHVDKVFAGMNSNMAIIDDAEIISIDVIELDDDEYFGMDFDSGEDSLELNEPDGKSISRGKTLEIISEFMSIRVGDTESDEPVRFYVYNEVQVGKGPVGPKPTAGATEEPTGNVTVAPTIVGTTVATAATEEPTEVVVEKPTKEPGFEAVFAISGLLAVAYLVLRKRE